MFIMLETVMLFYLMYQDFRFLKIGFLSLYVLSLVMSRYPISNELFICLPLLCVAYIGCQYGGLGWADFWLLGLMVYRDGYALLIAIILGSCVMVVVHFFERRRFIPYAGFLIIHWFIVRGLL